MSEKSKFTEDYIKRAWNCAVLLGEPAENEMKEALAEIVQLNYLITELQERNDELEYVVKQFNPQDVLEYEIEFRKQVKDE